MDKVKDYLPVLHLLNSKKVKPNVKKALLHCPDLCEVIQLCALNVLRGRVPLSAAQKKKLRRHKKLMVKLASKRINKKKKQKIILQDGGFLGGLLGPIIGTLAPLIGGLFK